MKLHRPSFRHKTDMRYRVQSIGMLMLMILTLCFNSGLANADYPCTCPPPPTLQQTNPDKQQADCDAICNDWAPWIPTSLSDSSASCAANTTSGITITDATKAAAIKAATDGHTKYGATVGFALYDSTGKRASYQETNVNYGASITKAMLLVAYLSQPNLGQLSTQAQDQLTKMITLSDNIAANWVYANIQPDANAAVNAVATAAHMSPAFKLDTTDATYVLGQSQITSDDFAKFFAISKLLIPDAYQSFALGTAAAPGILANLAAVDRTGILKAGLPTPVYSKEGWKPEPAGTAGAPYVVNQAAQFTDGTNTYGLAVTVGGIKDPKHPNDQNAERADGEEIIQNIAAAFMQSNQSTPVSTGGTTRGSSIDQVKTFASEPVTATWNISNATVEQWFLKQASAKPTIGKYGLNSGNIGRITSAVQAANVSPVFFYLYTVNEGGGAGGFINHYAGDVPGGGPANATRDANYLASQSKDKSAGPATGGGEPASLPTAEAQQILNALPSGSIGVVYIQATSAVTAELEDLSGKTGPWSGLFNKPLSDAMQNIKTMGGDPSNGGSIISTGSCTSGVTGQGIAKAVSWAIMIANNNGYGYDQGTKSSKYVERTSGWTKWKSDPSCTHQCGSFDCSSFIAAALTEAGYFQTNPNFNTGAEAAALTGVGFKKIADSATTSAGLQPGDILVWAGHTEMYIGKYKGIDQAVAAHADENGNAFGGQVGDQTGREISVKPFQASLSSDTWIGIYRAPN